MEEQFDNLNEAEEEIEETGEEPEEAGEETIIPDKFRDKSKEDVVKSYSELEKKLHEQSEKLSRLEKAKQEASTPEEKKEIKEEMLDVEKEILEEIEKADYSKMDPKEYGKFLVNKVKKMSEAISERKATDVYSKESNFRDKVRNDIRDVSKDYPILQEQTERGQVFRDVVLDIVSASKTRGEPITLKKAVEKASAIMKVEEVKKPKQVEKTQPQTHSQDKSDEDKVIEGIKNAGGGGMLGGL